jgi:hypothetical protein
VEAEQLRLLREELVKCGKYLVSFSVLCSAGLAVWPIIVVSKFLVGGVPASVSARASLVVESDGVSSQLFVVRNEYAVAHVQYVVVVPAISKVDLDRP